MFGKLPSESCIMNYLTIRLRGDITFT